MGYLGTKPQIATEIADGIVTSADLASGLTVNFADGSASAPSITNDGDTNTGIFFPAADTIAFAEGGAEVARFDSSGNLGVGTNNPTAKLHVYGATNSQLTLQNSNNSCFVGNISGSMEVQSADIIKFATGGSTERMRIDSSGRLLINRTTANAQMCLTYTGNTTEGFNINDGASSSGSAAMRFQFGGAGVGGITLTGSNTSYQTSSDYRLKEDIAPMVGALATVSALKPCTYKWKRDGSDGQGFIAHELQAIVPDCVSGEKDAVDEEGIPKYQGVDTSFLVATLTAAIQEQQAIITDLKARVEALENV